MIHRKNHLVQIFGRIKQSSDPLTKQSTKITLADKISMRLLGLEFKSDNTFKLEAIKHIFKKVLPDYE